MSNGSIRCLPGTGNDGKISFPEGRFSFFIRGDDAQISRVKNESESALFGVGWI